MNEKIPHYVNNPEVNAATAPELKLFRPKISFAKATAYLLVHLGVALAISAIWTLLSFTNTSNFVNETTSRFLIVLPVIFAITSRFSLIWFVRVYQHYAKPETRLRCCMTPSCSEYAILAFRKYGTIWGGIKTFKRLLRCHPPGGVDYP